MEIFASNNLIVSGLPIEPGASILHAQQRKAIC
jgi:hypothetical protein